MCELQTLQRQRGVCQQEMIQYGGVVGNTFKLPLDDVKMSEGCAMEHQRK